VSRRSKKRPENFAEPDGFVLCEDYPQCGGCTELDVCDDCGTPVCGYQCGGAFGEDDDDLLCHEHREQVEEFKKRAAEAKGDGA
jgi:hypothetical protein